MSSSESPRPPLVDQYHARLLGDVVGELNEAYEREHAAGRATIQSLAAEMGVNRSVVYRALTGGSNLTIKTIARLAFLLGSRISVKQVPLATHSSSNSMVIAPVIVKLDVVQPTTAVTPAISTVRELVFS